MTKEQKMDIVSMRLDGKTLDEIAEKYNCSKQNISAIIARISESSKYHRTLNPRKWLYPNLVRWMNQNEYSVQRMAREVGVTTETFMRYVSIKGHTDMKIGTARKIMEITFMSFEEAFAERTDVTKGG